MTAMTDYTEKKLVDHLLGQTAFTMPTEVALALHTANPTDVGSRSNEVSTSGSGYARSSIIAKMSAADATLGRSVNTSAITIGPATTDWGTVTYGSIDDDLSAGNMLLYGAPEEARTITIGQSFQLVPSQLAVRFE